MFKILYSEETVNKYDITLSENGQFIFQCARDYYNSCDSFEDIIKEVTWNECINKFSEIILKGAFSVTTGGKSNEVFDTYETVLTAQKLQELTNSNDSLKPIEKINNSAKYFWLAKMQYSTVITLEKISQKTNESLNNENIEYLISNYDFYNRVSAVMIETLAKSYQLQTTTNKEKDLIANKKNYISELCENIYKLEHCNYNLPTKEELDNKNCDVFKYFFEIQNLESERTNYTWHLTPTIEADDIIVSDKEFVSVSNPFDEYSILNENCKYNFIKYDGTCISDKKYDKWYYAKPYSIALYSKNNEWATICGDNNNEIIFENDDSGWCTQGFYIDNSTKDVYFTEFDSVSTYNEEFHVLVTAPATSPSA